MATSTATQSTPAVGSDLVRDKSTVKGFYKAVYVDGKFVDYRRVAKTQTADGENWTKVIAEGYSPFNENAVTRYTIKSLAAFELLVPDEAQRVYVVQAGLNYIQSTKQNAKAIEVKEGTGIMGPDGELIPPEPMYNNDEIDLKEEINTPPQKKSVDPQEKLLKQIEQLRSMLPPEVFQALLAQQAALSAASQATAAPTASDEEIAAVEA